MLFTLYFQPVSLHKSKKRLTGDVKMRRNLNYLTHHMKFKKFSDKGIETT